MHERIHRQIDNLERRDIPSFKGHLPYGQTDAIQGIRRGSGREPVLKASHVCLLFNQLLSRAELSISIAWLLCPVATAGPHQVPRCSELLEIRQVPL